MAAKPTVASLGLCVLLALLAGQLALAEAGNSNGVEGIVRAKVADAIQKKRSIGASLIRLLFHDCWVYGCDASVMLDTTPYSSSKGVEKNATGNIGLDGFDLIDDIKAAVGDRASCADILAFAARDAADILSDGKIKYAITVGRMDGVRSSAVDADATLPGANFTYSQLVANFANKSFSAEELVVLSGAHSIGVCHKSSFADRLTGGPINPDYQKALRKDVQSKSRNTANPTEKNNIRDMGSKFQKDSRYNPAGVNMAAIADTLDNSYYTANLQNMVLLNSDWELTTVEFAHKKLVQYRDNGTDWNLDFADAMLKLSGLKPPAGGHGQYSLEIRKKCRETNQKKY